MQATLARLLLSTTLLLLSACGPRVDLRVYVALDQEHSEALMDAFAAETGLVVDAEYDVEASKTVGLVSQILEERSRPRCDVFWNNELAQTVRLMQKNVTAPYVAKSAAAIPADYKDPDGHWWFHVIGKD